MARILIIDDHQVDVRLAAYLLSAAGHTPLAAGDGKEGMQMVASEAPDAVLCDIAMPNMDGYEVGRRLKASPEHQNLPVIAVTVLDSADERRAILAAGFDGYIVKPIDPRSFVRQVEAFLDCPQTQPVTCGTSETAGSSPFTEQPLCAECSQGTVLVVDDSLPNCLLLRAILEPHGYDVLSVTSVDDALALLEQNTPDVILSDLHMQKRSGLDFIRRVKADARWQDIPFLFVSSGSWPTGGERKTALDLGAVVFVTRPVEPEALVDEIEASRRERKEH